MSIGICNLNSPRIRTARAFALALICATTLSACVGSDGLSFAAPGGAEKDVQSGPVVPNTRSVKLARGAVTLDAPKGFCIDETSVKNGLQGSAAMLAKCTALDGKTAGADAAVISVRISARRGADAVAPSAQDIALAASPRVTLKTMRKGNLALAKIATGGAQVFSPADPVHWRGATMLDQRLVLLGVFAPVGSDLTTDKGADLLVSLARGLSATRGGLLGLAGSAPDGAAKISAADIADEPKKATQGLIARLLNRS